MSSALVAGLFAILGAGLALTSAACVVLWRRVRALTPIPDPAPVGDSPEVRDGLSASSMALPRGPARSRLDDCARRLDEMLGKHRALEARVARVEASAPGPAISRGDRPRPARRVDPGDSATSSGPTLIAVPDLAAPPASNAEAAAEFDRRFGPVWAMADEGTPVDAIARETGYPIGQVELILGLRRRLLGAEAGSDA